MRTVRSPATARTPRAIPAAPGCHRRGVNRAYNRTNTPPPSKTSSGATSPNGIRISGGIRA